MPESHARRRAALRDLLIARGLDALLVVDLCNVRYLTGFTGSHAALLVAAHDQPGAEDDTVFCTDGRYDIQSQRQVPDLQRIIDRVGVLALAARAGRDARRYRRTGFESQHVTVDRYDDLADSAHEIDLVRAGGLIEELRMIKDPSEIATLRSACAVADRALAELIRHGGLAVGRTEREVQRDLENRMFEEGATGPAFDTIVAAGANSAVPHHRPTDAVLRAGDFVKMDFGALVDGYHSDMTRTMVLGHAADWQRELYELVAAAQAGGRQALAAGQQVREVDRAARQVIEAAGHGERFSHGVGHGVGLEIHEAPALSKTGDGRLAAGMAVTVEPGVYFAGRGGVRIEDTLVVGDGTPELLTLTTKELVVV